MSKDITAIGQLIEDLKSVGIKFNPDKYFELEKKQIIEAYKDGFEENVRPKHDTAEIYYNETFKKDTNG